MTGPQEYEPVFEQVQIQATDLLFVKGVTVTAGPTPEELDEELPGAINQASGPMVMITVQGARIVPVNREGTRGRWHPSRFPMIGSWAELADLAATITGYVETMSDDARTRYLARYDRSLAGYRQGWAEFNTEQGGGS